MSEGRGRRGNREVSSNLLLLDVRGDGSGARVEA
jgi:hypothetical protein